MITYLKEQNLTPKASIFLPVFCKFALLNTTSIGMDVFSPRPSEPKKSKHMIMRRSLFILFFPILCLSIYAQNKPANEAGTLTAYYATTSFDRFKKGDLVCDRGWPVIPTSWQSSPSSFILSALPISRIATSSCPMSTFHGIMPESA